MSKVIILKNDRTGDLITSLPSINLLIKENPDKQIIIYLSEIKLDKNLEVENFQKLEIKTSSNDIKNFSG